MQKRLLILENAKEYKLEGTSQMLYDYKNQINFTVENGKMVPSALTEMNGPTHSKTMRAPADDDPDDGLCY